MGSSISANSADPTTSLKTTQQNESSRVFTDSKGKQYDKYLLNIDRSSMETHIYQFRKKNHFNCVIDTYFSDFRTNIFGCQDTSYNYEVVTQHLCYRLCQMENLNFTDATNMLKKSLKGFNIIYKYNGPFEVSSEMIGVNNENEVKVWLSKDLWKNSLDNTYLKYMVETFKKKQAIMVTSIIEVVNMKAQQSPQWKKLIIQLKANQQLLNFIDCQAYIERYCQQLKQIRHRMQCTANMNQNFRVNHQQQKSIKSSNPSYNFKCYTPSTFTQRKTVFLPYKNIQKVPQICYTNRNTKLYSQKMPKYDFSKSPVTTYHNPIPSQFCSPYKISQVQNNQKGLSNIKIGFKDKNIINNFTNQPLIRQNTTPNIQLSHPQNQNKQSNILINNKPIYSQHIQQIPMKLVPASSVRFLYKNNNSVKTHHQRTNSQIPTKTLNQTQAQHPIKQLENNQNKIILINSEKNTPSKTKQHQMNINQKQNQMNILNNIIQQKRYSNSTKTQKTQKQFQNYWRRQISIHKKNKQMKETKEKQEPKDQEQYQQQLCQEQAILRNPYRSSQNKLENQ